MNFTESCEATGRRPGSAGSRSRSAPRPGPAALLLLLLPLLLPPAAAAPLPAAADSSGEAGLEEEAGARRALPDCESLAWLLHSRAARLQDEVGTGPRRGTRGLSRGSDATAALGVSPQMCEKFSVCENSMEMLVRNNLNLPKVTEEDGCLLAGFDEARNRSAPSIGQPSAHPTRAPLNSARRAGNPELLLMFSLFSPQEKCLRKLSSGLFAFQTYLEFIQETFASEKQNVESLCYGTKHLATTIRQMVINPDEVVIPDSATQKSLLAKLKSDKAWIEKITTHLILRDFTSFMEKTVRAVRYLKNTRSFSA
ncbi:interleukin-6 [Phasianus colchicus]|uniref:interleukin-6 n=1 Tax=Phasianus colchicus TaxID=9054 RepID=UPI00129DC6F9|nr:interleukin-6 [Phasianus colchicus]